MQKAAPVDLARFSFFNSIDMRALSIFMAVISFLSMLPEQARAEFILSSAIIEFTQNGPRQQDVEIISRSQDNDYITAEVTEVVHPGEGDEIKRVIENPAESKLLVTPDKAVLPGGSRRVLRFVLLSEPDDQEHIYRVAVKPVIRGVEHDAKIGLKILVGYEALVIIRPAQPHISWSAKREGNKLFLKNNGNTNILLQNGQQCSNSADCKKAPVLRLYAGRDAALELPLNQPVTYSVWDGNEIIEKTFN